MKTIVVTALLLISNGAFAADCFLTTTRVACPGKEDAAFKPYKNQKTHTPDKPEKGVADEAACLKAAETSSKIIRKGTLSEKSVTAKFDGKDLGKTFSDKAECK